MRKDPQKARLYRAEHLAGVWQSETIATSIPDAQKWLNKVLKGKKVRTVFSSSPLPLLVAVLNRGITVQGHNGCSTNFQGGTARINMTTNGMRKAIFAHELAHLATWRVGEAHGIEFAQASLLLARIIVGKPYAERLQASYSIHKVRVKGKTGRPSIPRVPASQVAWCVNAKADILQSKELRSAVKKFRTEFIATIDLGEPWNCETEGCKGSGLGKVSVYRRSRVIHEYDYEFTCPLCESVEVVQVCRNIAS